MDRITGNTGFEEVMSSEYPALDTEDDDDNEDEYESSIPSRVASSLKPPSDLCPSESRRLESNAFPEP